MGMLQAHQGYFNSYMQFINDNRLMVQIPTNRRVTIFWEEALEADNQREAQRAAFEEFFAINRSLNDQGIEPLDQEFDAILAEGINIGRELDL